MSKVFYTSDTHIGHRKVSVERVISRPDVFGRFNVDADEDDMIAAHDATMAAIWDRSVTRSDIVWVVGDVSSGAGAAARKAVDWFVERPGRKFIVAGNHDPVHESCRDAPKWGKEFSRSFDHVCSAARVKINDQNVIVSHFPYVGDHSAEDRYTPWRKRDEGMPIIHGHTHSTEKVSFTRNGTVQIHVGVDAWDFAPVPLTRIAEFVGARTPA